MGKGTFLRRMTVSLWVSLYCVDDETLIGVTRSLPNALRPCLNLLILPKLQLGVSASRPHLANRFNGFRNCE
jgi:hypothetical protein